MAMTNTTKVLAELDEDIKRMVNLASDLQTRGFNDLAKKLDEEATVLIKIHQQVLWALRADGMTLGD